MFFAGTIEKLRAAAAPGATAFLSAGDNIGASLFASAVAKDQPTIDVLNALELRTSAVGNHEFDGGWADLRDRVIAGGSNAKFPYLGANVYKKGTTEPVLPEYTVLDMNGVKVAVIGTVTQETPSLVTPAGIADLEFGDAVDAINRVAAKIKADNLADVIIVENHDGAGSGAPEGSTLEQEVAAGGPFAKMVTEVTPDVAAIFNGHTHKQYSWDAPVPGVEGKTRPIVQTGNYGEFIGQIRLTIDTATMAVTGYTAGNVKRTTSADQPAADLVAAYPRVAAVKTIVDKALADAAVVGNQPVGSVTADITTAFTPATATTPAARDDRASESTLGNLVADSLVDSLKAPDLGGAEIGVVNPGGLRNELYYAPDGTITYAEANAVLPFVNNLWTTSLTGEQFKTLLEQQWQTNPDGTVPSRAYQQLGLSKNVNYTYDAARAAGDRITSIRVNGALIDPAQSYRIGTFSFLATGGDNFRIFKSGTNTKDSGLVDRDAWIKYLQAQQPGLAGLRPPLRCRGEHHRRRGQERGVHHPGRLQAGPHLAGQPGEHLAARRVHRCQRRRHRPGHGTGFRRRRHGGGGGSRRRRGRHGHPGAHRRRVRHRGEDGRPGRGQRPGPADVHRAGQAGAVRGHRGPGGLRQGDGRLPPLPQGLASPVAPHQ